MADYCGAARHGTYRHCGVLLVARLTVDARPRSESSGQLLEAASMPKKSKAAKLAKRVLRAAGAGDLAELQQMVTAAAALEGDAAGGGGCEAGVSPLLECADADECQPLVCEAHRHAHSPSRRLSPRQRACAAFAPLLSVPDVLFAWTAAPCRSCRAHTGSSVPAKARR